MMSTSEYDAIRALNLQGRAPSREEVVAYQRAEQLDHCRADDDGMPAPNGITGEVFPCKSTGVGK